MTHQVEVDRDEARSELLRLGEPGHAKGDQAKPTGGPRDERAEGRAAPDRDPEPAGWRDESVMVAEFLAGYLYGWRIPPHKQQDLAFQVERVLEKWAPGGGPNIDKWPPEVALLFTLGGIGMTCGVDWATMQLRHPRPPMYDPEPDQDQAEPDQAPEGERQAGPYTTDGGAATHADD